jgi:predicted Zn-ribbon and HTH transcriptional regulator
MKGKIPCFQCGFKGSKSKLLEGRFCPKCKIEMPSSAIQATEFRLATILKQILK